MRKPPFQRLKQVPVFAVAVTLLFTGAAHAVLNPVVTESGNIALSVDAGGNNGPYTIDADKPSAGATVRGAYFSCASLSNRVINDGDVTLAGTGVNWDLTAINNIGPTPFFQNVFADVTAIVAPTLDAAAVGRTAFSVAETATNSIDGCILAVIWDDPASTEIQTAILFFGGQELAGDTFNISLADPIDLNNPNVKLDFGLGISFGFQGTFMVSNVDVNGQRLTSSAGGQDDGGPFNGGLITVGGLDDSNANPANPNAGPGGNARFDDELYDLLPFVNNGDTLVTVDTVNPSNDDNIFFAHLCTLGVASAEPCTNRTTVVFDDPVANPPLNGVFGGIDWGDKQWNVDSFACGDCEPRLAYFRCTNGHCNAPSCRTFTFEEPSIFESLSASSHTNGGLMDIRSFDAAGDPLEELLAVNVTKEECALVETGFTQAAASVEICFDFGWELAVDNVLYCTP